MSHNYHSHSDNFLLATQVEKTVYSRYEHGQAIEKENGSIAWAYKDAIRKTRARAGTETERNVGSKKKLNKLVGVHWQQMEDLRKWVPLMSGAGNLILRMAPRMSCFFQSSLARSALRPH